MWSVVTEWVGGGTERMRSVGVAVAFLGRPRGVIFFFRRGRWQLLIMFVIRQRWQLWKIQECFDKMTVLV